MRSGCLLGDDVVELIKAEPVVVVSSIDDVGVVHHFSDLVVVHGLTQLSGDSLEGVEVDDSSSLGVPEFEDLGQALAALGVAGLGGDDLKELVELDGSVQGAEAVDHLEDDLATALEPEFFEDFFDFFGIDGSSSVGVEEFEGGLEFFVVVLGNAVLPAGLGFGSRGTLAALCRLAILHRLDTLINK